MTTKGQIIKAFNDLNEDAKSRWEDEKLLELCNFSENSDETKLTVGIGKFEQTFHDLVIDPEGITIKSQSAKNDIIEDVIEYVLKPIFF